MTNDLASLGHKVTAISNSLEGQTSAAMMRRVGKKLEPEIGRAVSADIGDTSMSGWRRGAPIAIVGASRVVNHHAVKVEPVGKSKGPMAVLERGRNIGNSGGMAGPGVSKDGTTRRNANGSLRKVRARKSKRWNGYTRAKNTMGDAAEQIGDKAPGLMAKEIRAELAKQLRR